MCMNRNFIKFLTMTSNHQKFQICASTLQGKFICNIITNAGLSLSLGIPLPQMAAITTIADTAQTVASVAESVASIAAKSVATVAWRKRCVTTQ